MPCQHGSDDRRSYECSVYIDRKCLGDVIVLNIVHGTDSIVCISLLGKANESETAGATSVTVLDDDL